MTEFDWHGRRVRYAGDSFERALQAFAGIVGNEFVKSTDAAMGFAARATVPDPRRPGAIVYPGSADEVAAIVKAANEFGVPLWPCGKGRNWGYGSATPVLEGTVVLHLERLNRIIEVNDELAYAVIEPGVSYRQLREHLDRHHPELWCDCTDGTPHGSVIGNALDRGLGTTHYADHFGTLCGLEVVLPTGETVRTGGGPPGCKTWNTHKWGVGPYLEGLFSQSNFGVVTKAGVWLMPRPEAFASFTFDLERAEDLPRLVDIIRDLALRGTVTSAVHLINDVVTLAVLTQYSAEQLQRYSRLPESELADMRRRFRLTSWTFGGGIQGTRRNVAAAKHELRKRLRGLGRLMFVDDRLIALVEGVWKLRRFGPLRPLIDTVIGLTTGKSAALVEAAPHIHGVLKGVPSDYFVRHAYFKSRVAKPAEAHPDRDDLGLVWFAPVVPMTGAHVSEVMGLCAPLFERFGFDFYAALLVQNPRSMIVLTSIFFLKDDPTQVRQAHELYAALSAAIAGAGYQTYRVSTEGMAALEGYAPGFVQLGRRLKGALDPEGILAPGKYALR